MKKLILNQEEVQQVYKAFNSLDKTAKHFGVSRPGLRSFMERTGIAVKSNGGDFYIDKQELTLAYNELKSTRLLAKRYNTTRSIIKRLCKDHGIELVSNPDAKRLVPEIIKLTNEGKNSVEIAETLSFSLEHINRVARDNGIKLNRRYHKGYIVTHNGYKMIQDKNNPDADSKGYVREHRKVAAESLGIDFLPKDLVCHHVDGNKLNNSPENLEVMTLSEHTRLHHGS